MNSPKVTALTAESAVEKLLYEWLTSYFDGMAHAVAGESAVCPAADIAFGVASASGPLNGARLTVITETNRKRSFLADRTNAAPAEKNKVVTWEAVRFRFLVRASVVRSVLGNSESVCRQIWQVLRALLLDPQAKYGLEQKGVRLVRTIGERAVQPGRVGSEAEILVAGEVHYEVKAEG